MIVTIWGDVGKECATMAALPGLMYAASPAQGISEEEMKRRFTEITGEDFEEMLSLDAPNDLYGENHFTERANYAMNLFMHLRRRVNIGPTCMRRKPASAKCWKRSSIWVKEPGNYMLPEIKKDCGNWRKEISACPHGGE